jgi:hypothetical protein
MAERRTRHGASRGVPKRHSAIDEVSRYCLVIGAILFLIANLIPIAGAKGTVLVFGEVFALVGIVGMGLAMLIGRR